MYSEGEHKYLQDLDCVNIVKSIRQLKALMRIMLTQQQQQLIAFERESVLPNNHLANQLEQESIQSKALFEYESKSKKLIYAEEVDKFVAEFASNIPSKLDSKIIDEV